MFNSFATPWTVARQAPLSVGFPRQEHWRGLPFPSPGDLPDPGFEAASPAFQADSLPLSHRGSPLMLYGGEAAPIPDVTVWGHDLGLPNCQPQFPHLQSLALASCPGNDSGFRISAFYTAKYGYKLCLRLYLNGDGTGKRTHLSLFIVIMRGEYDALLPWPFRNKVRDWETRGFLGWRRPGSCSWVSHKLICVQRALHPLCYQFPRL